MNKKTVLWIILGLVFVVVFNVVFFVSSGFKHPASTWISYGFIHLAYLMVIITLFLVRKSSSAAVFGFSLASISVVYFLIEFVVGIIFIMAKSESYKGALLAQIILAGIYVIMLVSHLIANETTADSLEQHEHEVAYVKTAASRVKALMGKAGDSKANKAIERVYDLINSSPTKSTSSVQYLESSLMSQISTLEDAVDSGESELIISTTYRITETMEERNRKLHLAN